MESAIEATPIALRKARTCALAASALALLTAAAAVSAQEAEQVRAEFLQWAEKSSHRVSTLDLDATTEDLQPIQAMIGGVRIVGLSEGQHAAAEPLAFRNRLFRHLIEHAGFSAIAIESGVLESRVLNDYVTMGKGELDAVLAQGFSWGAHTFRQNAELICWLREYNEGLPPNAAKVQVFGVDVPGSPGNFDAARRPDTALHFSLEYLRLVDPQAAAHMSSRVQAFLPVLNGVHGYGDLKESERDRLTAAIADLIPLMERNRLAYIEKSSKVDYEWAERAAIGARQTDAWFRRMPLGWQLKDGFEWTRYAMQVRDRAMADNFEWVLSRLDPHARVLLFAAVGHLAKSVVQRPAHQVREMVPLGAYLQERYGVGFVNILNLVMNGEIKYCSASPLRLMPLKPPPASAIETRFAALNVPQYFLDLRSAPGAVSAWLQQTHDHWNGFEAQQFATAPAFDIVYYVSPISSACSVETGSE